MWKVNVPSRDINELCAEFYSLAESGEYKKAVDVMGGANANDGMNMIPVILASLVKSIKELKDGRR